MTTPAKPPGLLARLLALFRRPARPLPPNPWGVEWIPWPKAGPCPLRDEEVEVWGVRYSDGRIRDRQWLSPSDGRGWDAVTQGCRYSHYCVIKWKPGFGPAAKPTHHAGRTREILAALEAGPLTRREILAKLPSPPTLSCVSSLLNSAMQAGHVRRVPGQRWALTKAEAEFRLEADR